MNRIEFKKKVLESAKARQQQLIDDFKLRIEEMRKSEMVVHDDEHDEEDRSYNASTSALVDGLAKQMNFLVEEMDFLNRMKVEDEEHQRVGIGSVVKTDKRTFYPSVSVETFRTNGDELFGISSKAPLFQVMNGKKAGESFSFKDTPYKILEVF